MYPPIICSRKPSIPSVPALRFLNLKKTRGSVPSGAKMSVPSISGSGSLSLHQTISLTFPLQESLLSKEAVEALFHDDFSGEHILPKRKILSAFPSVKEYVIYLTKNITGSQPSRAVSYLSYFGVAGIRLSASDPGDAFLVFDARQNIIIKEIYREQIPHTLLVP
jgi:hypothetical protein